MSIKHFLVAMSALVLVTPVFAHDDMSVGKPCESIVKSCLDAGYTRDASEGKRFWEDCLNPAMMGKSVSGVSVDAKVAKACRKDKIKELTEELKELKSVK